MCVYAGAWCVTKILDRSTRQTNDLFCSLSINIFHSKTFFSRYILIFFFEGNEQENFSLLSNVLKGDSHWVARCPITITLVYGVNDWFAVYFLLFIVASLSLVICDNINVFWSVYNLKCLILFLTCGWVNLLMGGIVNLPVSKI